MSKGSNRREEDTSKVHANWPWPSPLERKLAGLVEDKVLEPSDGLYPYQIENNNAWPFPASK
jgi:hypothetical protein